MVPGDRLVCTFVKPQQVGTEFVQWPLHVTVVPWFRTGLTSDRLAQMLQDRFSNVPVFLAYVGEEAVFGSGRVVNLLEDSRLWQSLARNTRQLLKNNDAWLVDETTKRVQAFRPHVTIQTDDRLESGDSFPCEGLSIVLQLGAKKVVQQEVKFWQ